MASHNDADSSCDEATSSLGDSTYDFIDDKSTTTDDEDGDHMTESTSSESFEADRPVVVPPQRHGPPRIHTEVDNDDFDGPPLIVKTPTYTSIQTDAPRSSEAVMGEQSLAEDPDEPIEFDEPSVINVNNISRLTEVSHTLRVVEDPGQVTGKLQDLIKSIPRGKINVVVRQTMTSHSIDLKGQPYKILIVGDLAMKEPVIQKIGGALAANSRPSTPDFDDVRPTKFNIVPVSAFGDSGHPEVVLIDSSGLEMCVEDCISATWEEEDSLVLQMANKTYVQSWRSRSKYRLSEGWTLPDLAIICITEDETFEAKRTRSFARSFMDRHDVPSIVIQKQATWDHAFKQTSATVNYLTPHLHLQSQQLNTYTHRYPIDLATFLSIDAGQLNRNLACLAASKRASEPQGKSQTREKKLSDNVWYSNAVDALHEISSRTVPRDLASFFPFLLIIFVTTVPWTLWGSFSGKPSLPCTGLWSTNASVSTITGLAAPVATTQLSLLSTGTLTGSSVSSKSSQMASSRAISSNTDIASFLLDAYTLGPNKSDKFMVQVLGDRHIVVSAPRWLHKTKKAPSLLFRVSRQNWTIEHVLSTLGEGVYALQIPYEEAVGTLNISMSINSKGTPYEETEVNFGASWLNMAAWKRAARVTSKQMRKDMSTVQTGLATAYNQTKSDLSTLVEQTKSRYASRRKMEQALLATRLKWGAQTRELVVQQTKDITRNLLHRFHAERKQISGEIKYLTEHLSRRIFASTRSRTSPLSHRLFAHLRMKSHGGAGLTLKNSQKAALRAWWKVVGVPKTSRLPLHKHDGEVEDSN